MELIYGSVRHPSETGSLIEQSFRKALVEILPERIGVSHGFVVDSQGGRSQQMDIVLYDRPNTPMVYSSEGAQIFPVEATIACGEVKSQLSAAELRDAFSKCLSYKRLRRQAYHLLPKDETRRFNFFGRVQDHWPSLFFCLSYGSTDCRRLRRTYDSIVSEDSLSLENRIDAVVSIQSKSTPNCLLNKNGVDPEGIIRFVSDGSTEIRPHATPEPWALFALLLLQDVVVYQSAPINMLQYDSTREF